LRCLHCRPRSVLEHFQQLRLPTDTVSRGHVTHVVRRILTYCSCGVGSLCNEFLGICQGCRVPDGYTLFLEELEGFLQVPVFVNGCEVVRCIYGEILSWAVR
jgi:hypothetical protein